MSGPADVLVVGAGPAGWSTAAACAARGLDVALVDPRPDAVWRHTYGAWSADLPADLPPALVAASGAGVAIAGHTHHLDEVYAVLDTPGLQRHLRHPGVRVHRGRVVGAAGPGGVVLTDGTTLRAAVVADATGAAQTLSHARSRHRAFRPRAAAEQTAYGVAVDASTAARVTGGRLLFMDWRPVHGEPGWPTFLYAVPLGGGRVLLEETALARRPGLPLGVLRRRLRARLRAHGLDVAQLPSGGDDVEKVRFPVDRPRHRSPAGVVALGAAAPLVHPASGFSVTTSLHQAPRVASAVVAALEGTRAGTAVGAARAVTTSPAARVVHAMRHRGLDVLLRMPPAEVPTFFDHFFALPARHRRAYLGAGDDVAASMAAMLALFARLPARMRSHLVAGSVLGPGPEPVEPAEAPDTAGRPA